MAESNIGPGQDPGYVDLSTWETALDGVGGDQTAILKADIVDDCEMLGWPDPSTITIKGDLPGNTKRKITGAPGDPRCMYIWNASGVSLILEDLELDGVDVNAQCLVIGGAEPPVTIDRVKFSNAPTYGLQSSNSPDVTQVDVTNCIFDGAGTSCVLDQHAGANSCTHNLYNCLFTGAGGHAHLIFNDAAQTWNFYNCVSHSNVADDFDESGGTHLANTNLYNCVSEDASATSGDHDTTSNCVSGKTELTTYFRQPSTGDYQLLQNDSDNWTIDGDSANTPALDFASVVRTNDDIGPFDFRAYTYKQLLLVNETPGLDGVITDESGFWDDAQAVDSPCLTFDGAGDKVVCAASTGVCNEGGAMSFGGYFDIATGDNSMVSKGINSQWFLAQNGTLITVRIGGTASDLDYTFTEPAGNYHIFATVDGGSPNKCNLYIDGLLVDGPTTVNDVPAADGTSSVQVGMLNTVWAYAGQVCDVRVYNSELTADEVLWLGTSGASGTEPTATPEIHLPMSEGSGSTCYDVSGNERDGTITAAVWGTTQDKFHWSLAKGCSRAAGTYSDTRSEGDVITMKVKTTDDAVVLISDENGGIQFAVAADEDSASSDHGDITALTVDGDSVDLGAVDRNDIFDLICDGVEHDISMTMDADYATWTEATYGRYPGGFYLDNGYIRDVKVNGVAVTLTDVQEVPALADGTLDAAGNAIEFPAGPWHNQCSTKISNIYNGVADADYAAIAALSDPNFVNIDSNGNARWLSEGAEYTGTGSSVEDVALNVASDVAIDVVAQ